MFDRWHTFAMLPAPLPDLDGLDPEALKALLIAKHNESVEQHKRLRSTWQEIEHLKLVIEKYRRMIFGRKSEKLTRELEQLELRLEELETTQAADQPAEDAAEAEQPGPPSSVSKPAGTRPRRRPLPEDLPREVITHMPEHDSCPCCRGELRQFGEDVSEQLERIPATFKVIRHVRLSSRALHAIASSKLLRLRGRSHTVCLDLICWRMYWYPSSAATSLSIDSPGSSQEKASIWIARPWPAGLVRPGSCSLRWWIRSASMS